MKYKTQKKLRTCFKYILLLMFYYIINATKVIFRVVGFLTFLFGILSADSGPFFLPPLLMIAGAALLLFDYKVGKREKPQLVFVNKKRAKDYSKDMTNLYIDILIKEICS